MKYSVPMQRDLSKRQYEWMLEHFGRHTRGTKWTHKMHRFYFQSEADLLVFLLRWS